jgi:hypothetical protein
LPPSELATEIGRPPFELAFALPEVLPFEVDEPVSADEPHSARPLHVAEPAFDDWSTDPAEPPLPPFPPLAPDEVAELSLLVFDCEVDARFAAICAAICAATGTLVVVVVVVVVVVLPLLLFEFVDGSQLPKKHVVPPWLSPAKDAGTTTSETIATTKPTIHLILGFKVRVSFRACWD